MQTMGTTFFIELNMKTASGFECYGTFDLGEDRDFAISVFSKLEGRSPETDPGVLQIDMVEKYRGLPINIQMLSCSAEELCRNVRFITRETFKRLNLKDMEL